MILNQVKPGQTVTFMKSLANEIRFIVYIVYKISIIDLTESFRVGNKWGRKDYPKNIYQH